MKQDLIEVITENSTYEINIPERLIRRVRGEFAMTRNEKEFLGEDNAWGSYSGICTTPDKRLFILWTIEGHFPLIDVRTSQTTFITYLTGDVPQNEHAQLALALVLARNSGG